MNNRHMILPAKKPESIRLIRIPDDYQEQEAYRYVTGLIAQAEEKGDFNWDTISDLLEDRGFEAVEFILGPTLNV